LYSRGCKDRNDFKFCYIRDNKDKVSIKIIYSYNLGIITNFEKYINAQKFLVFDNSNEEDNNYIDSSIQKELINTLKDIQDHGIKNQ
jgi:hypothetical protein